MPTVHTLLAFSAIAFALIILPGPSVLFIVGRALQHGRREALISVLGNSAGTLVQTLFIALGVGALIMASSAAFMVMKVLGGAYLIYLGVQAIRHRHDGLSAIAADAPPAPRVRTTRVLGESFVVGVTNPKTLVFIAAVLPQFVNPSAGAVAPQVMVLGLVFTAIAVVSDGTYALIAAQARRWLGSSPRRIARIRAAGGGMMAALGVLLMASRRAA